jgi:excisionase family DNA binding protein
VPESPATAEPIDLDTLVDLLAKRLDARLGASARQRYLSVADAATYSGLSPDSVRSMLASGKLTGYRPVAGRVVIDRKELDALIQSSTRHPRRGRGHYERRETKT